MSRLTLIKSHKKVKIYFYEIFVIGKVLMLIFRLTYSQGNSCHLSFSFHFKYFNTSIYLISHCVKHHFWDYFSKGFLSIS